MLFSCPNLDKPIVMSVDTNIDKNNLHYQEQLEKLVYKGINQLVYLGDVFHSNCKNLLAK